MKKLDATKFVEFNQELQHMIDYTLNIWDGDKDSLTQIITESFNQGYIAGQNWIDSYSSSISEFVSDWMDSREALATKSDMMFYDDVTKVAKSVMMHSSSVKDAVLTMWDYSKTTEALTKSLKPSLANPKGWKKVLSSEKSAFEYFDDFGLKEDKLFKGHNSDSASSPGFHGRINLANTFYGDKEQGRTPLYNLVSSAFAHGLIIRENNNTFEVLKEIKQIKKDFEKEEFNKPVYIGDLQSLSANKLFKALMVDKYDTYIEKEYNSQNELDTYLKEKNENKDTYGLVKFQLTTSDNFHIHSFKLQKIYTIEHFEKQIKNNVEVLFKAHTHKNLYYSDDNPVELQKSDILSSLSFKQVSQKQFETFRNMFGNGTEKSLSFGQEEHFMDYKYPTTDELVEMNANRLKSVLASLKSTDIDPKVEIERKERDETYRQKILSILEIKVVNKNKPK